MVRTESPSKDFKAFLADLKANPGQRQLRLAGQRQFAAPGGRDDEVADRHLRGACALPRRRPGTDRSARRAVGLPLRPRHRHPARQGRQAAHAGRGQPAALSAVSRSADAGRTGAEGLRRRHHLRLLCAGGHARGRDHQAQCRDQPHPGHASAAAAHHRPRRRARADDAGAVRGQGGRGLAALWRHHPRAPDRRQLIEGPPRRGETFAPPDTGDPERRRGRPLPPTRYFHWYGRTACSDSVAPSPNAALDAPTALPAVAVQPGARHRRVRHRRHPRAGGAGPERQRRRRRPGDDRVRGIHRLHVAAAAGADRALAAPARDAARPGAVHRGQPGLRLRPQPELAAGRARADGHGRDDHADLRRRGGGACQPGAAWPRAVAGVPRHKPELRDRHAAGGVAGLQLRLALAGGPGGGGLAAGRAGGVAPDAARPERPRRQFRRPAAAAGAGRGGLDAVADAAVLHRHLHGLLVHRPGAAGAGADVGRTAVLHADALRPGRRGRHADGRLAQRPLRRTARAADAADGADRDDAGGAADAGPLPADGGSGGGLGPGRVRHDGAAAVAPGRAGASAYAAAAVAELVDAVPGHGLRRGDRRQRRRAGRFRAPGVGRRALRAGRPGHAVVESAPGSAARAGLSPGSADNAARVEYVLRSADPVSLLPSNPTRARRSS